MPEAVSGCPDETVHRRMERIWVSKQSTDCGRVPNHPVGEAQLAQSPVHPGSGT